MDTLILEDFRCFAGRHEVPLRPLTLLVGENSSGKTSFLAAANVAAKNIRSFHTPDFNQPPFALGAFQEIAYSGGSRESITMKFTLGVGVKSHNDVSFEFQFAYRDSQPELSRWMAKNSDKSLVVDLKRDRLEWLTSEEGHKRIPHHLDPLAQPQNVLVAKELGKLFNLNENDEPLAREMERLLNFLQGATPVAFGPMRAKPERTYEQTSDTTVPEGGHVPVVLARKMHDKGWQKFEYPLLVAYARAAGLFDKVAIRNLGKNGTGPFQINVRLDGNQRNIIDVGYGVSQALPLVFEVIRGRSRSIYLVQQPEVHLHPRAQAELATLFGSLAKSQDKQFLIETHSDYLIDRVRMDVREKNHIGADDVVILYFERGKRGVRIYPIFLDEQANLLDAPPTYRSFFLSEQRRFWGIE